MVGVVALAPVSVMRARRVQVGIGGHCLQLGHKAGVQVLRLMCCCCRVVVAAVAVVGLATERFHVSAVGRCC